MKKILSQLVIAALVFTVLLPACTPDDTTPPTIYILGKDGIIIQAKMDEEGNRYYDTVILLWVDYTEPERTVGDFTFVGAQYEDNATPIEDIKFSTNIDDVVRRTNGYVNRAIDREIEYHAVDEEGNERTAIRNLIVRNISEAYAGRYRTSRSSFVLSDTSYISNIRPAIDVPGRLVFPRVYLHTDTATGQPIFYRVNADLWSPDTGSDERDDFIAFMGVSTAEKSTPFFKDMTYEEGLEAILDYRYLRIDAQEEYTDTLGNLTIIEGRRDANTNKPLSKIEFFQGTNTVHKITLHLNVTMTGRPPDNVVETYVVD